MLDGSISGVYYGAFLYSETGDVFKHNTIETYDGGYGVYSDDYLTGVMIMGNAFTSDAAQTGTAYYGEYDAGTVFSGNTVTALEYGVYSEYYDAGFVITNNVFGGAAPADGCDYGIYIDEYDHGHMIAGNYIRNSFDNAVYDGYSFNNTYVGNIATANGRAADDATYYIYPETYGPVTMVNNYARLGYSYGFYVYEAYSDNVSGPPYSYFAGNNAIANGTDGSPGFYDYYSVGSTWTGNYAYANAYNGFQFDYPWREIVTGNMSKLNGSNGFYFYDVEEDYQPLAVSNNSATYNGGYGFTGYDSNYSSDAYPVAGSGNTGGGTNGAGDCYLVAGCS